MNKILIVILVLGAGALALYLMGGNTDNLPEGTLPDDVNVENVEEALKEEGDRTVYGSCNVVTGKSTCVDYVGSFWNDNNGAQLNCDGAGSFSKNTCPYSNFGGCQIGGGTVTEIVTWHYREGGGGFDDENIQYAVASCNALPNATWVIPETLLP